LSRIISVVVIGLAFRRTLTKRATRLVGAYSRRIVTRLTAAASDKKPVSPQLRRDRFLNYDEAGLLAAAGAAAQDLAATSTAAQDLAATSTAAQDLAATGSATEHERPSHESSS
jgi:hypothetical protein